jgi:hypothetical protein
LHFQTHNSNCYGQCQQIVPTMQAFVGAERTGTLNIGFPGA